MNEFKNIMRAEIARTGNYGNDCDEAQDIMCPVCGKTSDKFYVDKFGDIVGCDNCIEIRYCDEI